MKVMNSLFLGSSFNFSVYSFFSFKNQMCCQLSTLFKSSFGVGELFLLPPSCGVGEEEGN